MSQDTPTPPARFANGRFGPGNPGRPLGAYGRASRRAALKITRHFEAHGEAVLDRVAEFNSPLYFQVVGRVLPRQVDLAELESAPWTEGEAQARLAEARQHCQTVGGDARAALAGLVLLLEGADSEPENR